VKVVEGGGGEGKIKKENLGSLEKNVAGKWKDREMKSMKRRRSTE